MHKNIAIAYILAGVVVASLTYEMHRLSCAEKPFGVYILVAGLWPIIGGGFIIKQLATESGAIMMRNNCER